MCDPLPMGRAQDVEDTEPDPGRPHVVHRAVPEERAQRNALRPCGDRPQEFVVLDDVDHDGHPPGADQPKGLGLPGDPHGGAQLRLLTEMRREAERVRVTGRSDSTS